MKAFLNRYSALLARVAFALFSSAAAFHFSNGGDHLSAVFFAFAGGVFTMAAMTEWLTISFGDLKESYEQLIETQKQIISLLEVDQ